jgi:hypothetical protein
MRALDLLALLLLAVVVACGVAWKRISRGARGRA